MPLFGKLLAFRIYDRLITHTNALTKLQIPLCNNSRAHTHKRSIVSSPVHLWLVVQPEDEVGEQLEEVLPQQESHIKIKVAYVRLAHVPSEAHVAHTDKSVDEVSAVAPVQTRVGLALIYFLFAPTDTQPQSSQRQTKKSLRANYCTGEVLLSENHYSPCF